MYRRTKCVNGVLTRHLIHRTAMTDKANLADIVRALSAHESRARNSFNLTPSENIISPLAKVPLVADVYSRYYFEHLKLHGEWMFWGGIEAGQIQSKNLEPVLRRLAKAQHVETRPLSGLNCMAIVISGLCPPGGTLMTIPIEAGGHMSTPNVAARLGVSTIPITMDGHDVNLDHFEQTLQTHKINVVYLDQSTQLFPIDPHPLRLIIDRVSPHTLLHCDTSHTNGLVLGGVLANPLERGAHTFGGSTHKTLPGPHKAFIATNDALIAELISSAAFDLISHHQVSSSISLAITLDEFEHKEGSEYALQVKKNAKIMAATLASESLIVGGGSQGWTNCHQVWVAPPAYIEANDVAAHLYDVGLLVNVLPGLPFMPRKAFRLSSSELTRLGATEQDICLITQVLAEALHGHKPSIKSKNIVRDLRELLNTPQFCYNTEEIETMEFCIPLKTLARALIS